MKRKIAPLTVPDGWLGNTAAEHDPTGNIIQKWSKPDKPRRTLIPDPVREAWPGKEYELARYAVKTILSPQDQKNPERRTIAFKWAIRRYMKPDGTDYTVKNLRRSYVQADQMGLGQ